MTPLFFPTPAGLCRWFEENHATATELFLGYYKVGAGRPSVTWPESVREALRFGWIDGVRRSLDADRYMIRFTPRKPGSVWSAVNIRHVGELTEQGLMHPAGLAAFEKRRHEKSEIYAYEQKEVAFSPEYEALFRARPQAWEQFQKMPKSYRTPATWWVMSAKQEATRLKRLETLIDDSAAGRKLKQYRRPGDKG